MISHAASGGSYKSYHVFWASVMFRLRAKTSTPHILGRVLKSSVVDPDFQVTELGLREVKTHPQSHTASTELHQHQ